MLSKQNLAALCANIANWISAEAKQKKMLFQSPAEIETMINEGRGFVIREGGMPVSFAGFTPWPHYLEIGSLITHPDFRRHGFGKKALEAAIFGAQAYDTHRPLIGLCNPDSAAMLKKLGFRPEIKSPVHAELWEACHKCLEYGNWPTCHCQFLMLGGKLYHDKISESCAVINLAPENREDMELTASLYSQVWQEPPWNETDWEKTAVIADFLETLRMRESQFLIAYKESKVIGFSVGYRVDADFIAQRFDRIAQRHFCDQERPIYYIAELAVDAAYRHLGVGKILSSALIERLDPKNCGDFILRTHVEAEAAQRLYQKLGFFDTGYPDPTYQDRTYWRRIIGWQPS